MKMSIINLLSVLLRKDKTTVDGACFVTECMTETTN